MKVRVFEDGNISFHLQIEKKNRQSTGILGGDYTGILGLDRGLQTFFPWENWIIFVRWLLGNYWIMNMQIMPGFFLLNFIRDTDAR